MKGEQPILVRDPHGPIHTLFHEHVGCPDIGPHLIELPVVGYGPVSPDNVGIFRHRF